MGFSNMDRADLERICEQQRLELFEINTILSMYGVDLKKGAKGVLELAQRGNRGRVCTCDPPKGMLRHALNCQGFPHQYRYPE